MIKSKIQKLLWGETPDSMGKILQAEFANIHFPALIQLN